MLNSSLGREILADVLDAASEVLRRDRGGRQVAQAVNTAAEAGADAAATAGDVGTEVASGAMDAGARITSSMADMAETAVGSLAAMATGAVLDMLPGRSSDEDEPERKKRGRRGKRQAGDEEGAAS